MTYTTSSADETIELGIRLAQSGLDRGAVLLIGNLGAGKTTLAKGIVEGLGVVSRDEVSSPTFPLIHEYGDPVRVYHVDLYRLDTTEEVRSLGLEDLMDRTDVLVLLEWAERFPALLPPDRKEIRITKIDDTAQFEVTECGKA